MRLIWTGQGRWVSSSMLTSVDTKILAISYEKHHEEVDGLITTKSWLVSQNHAVKIHLCANDYPESCKNSKEINTSASTFI